MEIRRRRFLYLAVGAAACQAVSRTASAQSYPARPVRIVVGYAAGGGTDIVARLMGQWLSERLGQQFVIENRTGAATNIGTEAVVRAFADGYTLLLAHTANAINATLYERLSPSPTAAWSRSMTRASPSSGRITASMVPSDTQ